MFFSAKDYFSVGYITNLFRLDARSFLFLQNTFWFATDLSDAFGSFDCDSNERIELLGEHFSKTVFNSAELPTLLID
jgi:hypothetical protein